MTVAANIQGTRQAISPGHPAEPEDIPLGMPEVQMSEQ